MRHALVAMSAIFVCLVPARAHAQHPESASVGASLSLLGITDADLSTMPPGWLVSGSRRLNYMIDIVGEAGGNYPQGGDGWVSLHTFMAGVRFSPARPGVRPFGQVLAGALIARCCGGGSGYMIVEPGGGLEIPVGSRTAARVGISLPFPLTGSDSTPLLRIQAGVVFRLGSQ